MMRADAATAATARISPDGGGYRRDIDGLRCIAVSSVVFYHAGLWPLRSGFVGVDIFFVISGFLIGGILHREIQAGAFSFANFYARRARRILPAMLALTLFVCLASLALMDAHSLQKTGLSGLTALLGVSNIYFWWSTNYFAAAAHLNPFLMTWSLGVEEQFYLFFPPLLLALERWGKAMATRIIGLLVVVSFTVCVAATAYYPTMAFYLLPMRAWELGAGSLLAMTWREEGPLTAPRVQQAAGFIGLATVLASCVLFDRSTAFPGAAALLPVAGTLLLLLSRRSWVNQRLLSAAPMVAIGLVSYSWYLWHAPLMAFTRLSRFDDAGADILSVVALISLGCAWLSWRFIERPFRHGRAPAGRTLRSYGVVLAACAAIPLAFVALKGLPQRLSPHQRSVEQALVGGEGNPCLIGYGKTEPSRAPQCLGAVPGARHSAVLVGDSHAAALGLGLRDVAAGQKVSLQQFEKGSCLHLIGATRAMLLYPTHAAECAAYNQQVSERVARDPAIKTVILTGFWSATFQKGSPMARLVGTDGGAAVDQTSLLKSALTETVRHYRALGKAVILISDVPLFKFDPGKEVTSDAMPARYAVRQWFGTPADAMDGQASRRWLQPATVADDIVRDVALAEPGVRYVDLRDRFCDARLCTYAADVPYYIDFQHLSRPGAIHATAGLRL